MREVHIVVLILCLLTADCSAGIAAAQTGSDESWSLSESIKQMVTALGSEREYHWRRKDPPPEVKMFINTKYGSKISEQLNTSLYFQQTNNEYPDVITLTMTYEDTDLSLYRYNQETGEYNLSAEYSIDAVDIPWNWAVVPHYVSLFEREFPEIVIQAGGGLGTGIGAGKTQIYTIVEDQFVPIWEFTHFDYNFFSNKEWLHYSDVFIFPSTPYPVIITASECSLLVYDRESDYLMSEDTQLSNHIFRWSPEVDRFSLGEGVVVKENSVLEVGTKVWVLHYGKDSLMVANPNDKNTKVIPKDEVVWWSYEFDKLMGRFAQEFDLFILDSLGLASFIEPEPRPVDRVEIMQYRSIVPIEENQVTLKKDPFTIIVHYSNGEQLDLAAFIDDEGFLRTLERGRIPREFAAEDKRTRDCCDGSRNTLLINEGSNLTRLHVWRSFEKEPPFEREYWTPNREVVGEFYVDKFSLPENTTVIPVREFHGDEINLVWLFKEFEDNSEVGYLLGNTLGFLTIVFKE